MTDTKYNQAIEESSEAFVAKINIDNLKSLTDDVIEKSILNTIDQVNGHAVAIWLPDEKDGQDVLTIAYNVGDKGPEVEGVISQKLDEGLVSKSFKNNETVCHQGFFKHREQSSSVDKKLGQITAHQIASPFRLFGKTIGAITVIQTLAAGVEQHSDWGFNNTDIQHFESSVQITQRLFELNVIRKMD